MLTYAFLFIIIQALDILTTLIGISLGYYEVGIASWFISIEKVLELKLIVVPLLILICWLRQKWDGKGIRDLKIITVISAVPVTSNLLQLLF